MSNRYKVLENGEKIGLSENKLDIPDNPIIPYIEGDGIGVDITPAMKIVVDAAIEKAYGQKRKIHWWNIAAGETAFAEHGEYLPNEVFEIAKEYHVMIKGPLTTPVGGGIRSLNVTLRQELDLYACIRPVNWISGVPAPVKRPQDLDVVIYRENSEDTYLGIEFSSGSKEAAKVIELLEELQSKKIRKDSGIGIKPISKTATERLCESAIKYCIQQKLPSITIVHKGNIMKYTEGAFNTWAYEFFTTNYRDIVVTETELSNGEEAGERIVIKDRIADAMFQQLLLRPAEYSILLAPNLNGDYISDAAAAQVGGLGMAPGANIGDKVALFEATHGTAPKYAGQDKVNPGSLILSAAMMLDYMGWNEAATLIRAAMAKTVSKKLVTYDLERQMEGATLLKCSEFAKAITSSL